MSFGQQLQDENKHTLAFGVDVVLLGRAESVVLIGRPGDRARQTGESKRRAPLIHAHSFLKTKQTYHGPTKRANIL